MSRISLSTILVFSAACMPAGFMGGGGGSTWAPSQAQTPDQQAAPPDPSLVATPSASSLGRLTNDDVTELRPALSPDGKALLYAAWIPEVVDGSYTGNAAQEMVMAINPETGANRKQLSTERARSSSPDWLPDGKGVVFVSDAMGTSSLVRSMSRSSAGATRLVLDGRNAPGIGGVRVSPDGTQVAFHTKDGDRYMVHTVGLNGAELTQVVEGSYPAWSPDGKQLVFQRSGDDGAKLFLVDAESGGGLTQLTVEGSAGQPSFSPDGKWIVFASNLGWNRFPSGSADNTWNLYAIRTDGTELTQLTDGARFTTEPCWGKDGWIYFNSNEGGTSDLWRLRPALTP